MTSEDLRIVLKEANYISDINRAIDHLKKMLLARGFCNASTFEEWIKNYQADRSSLVAEEMLSEQLLNGEYDESSDIDWVN
ncbi:hypothetical protein AB6C43_22035 [Vibrio splendidus]